MIKKHIPNGLSILNLISGTVGTLLALNGYLEYAAYSIFLGAVFDFLDGFCAKLLHLSSPLGKELDSLADLITFGMVPAAILYMLINNKSYSHPWYAYAPLGMVVCVALRLAKFNVDNRQSEQFIGLPSPANASLIATFPIILKGNLHFAWRYFLTEPLVLILLTILLSYLLIADIPFMSLKFKKISFKSYKANYCFILLWLLLILFMKVQGLFLGIGLYILFSVFQHIKKFFWR